MNIIGDRAGSLRNSSSKLNTRSSAKFNRLRDITKKNKEEKNEVLNDSLNETIKCLEHMWEKQKNNSIVMDKPRYGINDTMNQSRSRSSQSSLGHLDHSANNVDSFMHSFVNKKGNLAQLTGFKNNRSF